MAYIAHFKDLNDVTYDIKSKVTQAIPFGSVDSSSTATRFIATVDGISELYNGVCCYIQNGVVDSASGAMLNINSLGNKPVYLAGESLTALTTQFKASCTALFVYNTERVSSGCWEYYSGQDTTYTLAMSSNVITLTGSDGNVQRITLPVYNGGIS
mgnify:CR=1 FL=1